MTLISIYAVALVAAACDAASTPSISALEGYWRTVRHSADVQISDCGDGTPCGALRRFDDALADGNTRDINNPNTDLRSRPLVGLPILWGFSCSDKGWRKGRLYNPETGQTFRASLDVISVNKIKVKGCLGPFCRAQIWHRLSDKATVQTETITND
ncbi:MAG: DUF2147 domain-containing protein [Pseudomonadota bacterium]